MFTSRKYKYTAKRVFTTLSLLLLPVLAFSVTNTVPWNDDFESYDDYTPLIDGLNGWYGSDTGCVVRVGHIFSPYSGTKAVDLPSDTTLSNKFDGASASNVWIQADVRPVLYDGYVFYPNINTNATAMFYISSNGYFTVRDGTNWAEITDTSVGKTSQTYSATNWVRLHWRQNYDTKKWALFANYNLITNQIGFINTNATGFSGFDMHNGSVSTTYVDNVAVNSSNPDDLANDGGDWLPHMWVSTTNLHFDLTESFVTTETFRIRKTNGFFNLIFTNISTSSWLTVLDPQGTNSGDIQTIRVQASSAQVQPSTNLYIGQIIVSGMETNFGFTAKNSPHVIQVTALIGMDPPSNLQASKGTFSEKIRLTWDAVRGTDEYVIYRNTANNKEGAVETGTSPNTYFEDTSAMPGVTYWYWIKCKYQGIIYGDYSGSSFGFLGVQPPGGVSASDGAYTNFTRITWNPSDGAIRYHIDRHLINSGMDAVRVGTTTGTTFDDTTAVEGALYYYWIRAADNICLSHQSQQDSGYRGLPPPSGLSATRGRYTDKIIVSWNVSEPRLNGGTTIYKLWRNVASNFNNATLLIETTREALENASYEDYNIDTDKTYYYWLQGANPNCVSANAGATVGWTAQSGEDPYVYDGLSGNISITTNTTYSCNWGGFEHPDLDSYQLAIGTSAGAKDVMNWSTVGGSPYTWNGTMTQGKSYYATVRGLDSEGEIVIEPVSSDGLTCIGSKDTPGELVPVYRLYSYGDPKSTFEHLFTTNVMEMLYLDTLPSWQYEGIAWYGFVSEVGDSSPVYRLYCQLLQVHLYTMNSTEYIMLSEEDPLWEGEGPQYYAHENAKPGTLPVYRFYHPGYKRHFYTIDEEEKNTVKETTSWGWNYEGIAFYTFPTYVAENFQRDKAAAEKTIRSANETQTDIQSGTPQVTQNTTPIVDSEEESSSGDSGALPDISTFEEIGAEFVPGDYNADGIEDFAFYDQTTGLWYIWSASDGIIAWAEQWGNINMAPVSGDYNGSGLYDMAVYDQENGSWFIRTISGELILWNEIWGAQGLVPIPVDYDEDGVSDMAVFDPITETWFIRSVNGEILYWPE